MAKKKKQNTFVAVLGVYSRTLRADRVARWRVSIGFLLPLALGAFAANTLGNSSVFSSITWYVTGLLAAILTSMILLNRPAERLQLSQFEGKPGASMLILKNLLKRTFSGSEEPVGVNPRTQDMVFRIVGAAGIVVIAEGNRNTVRNLVEEQRRIAQKVANGVPFTVVYVGQEEHSVRLSDLGRHILKLKRSLNRREIRETNNRLGSMGLRLPIPKGIDPSKVRASRR
jgi:hypothetical protein